MIGALCQGSSRVTNLLRSDDVGRSRKAMEDLGVEIRDEGEAVVVEGRGPEGLREPDPPGRLDMGNSGTTTRLLLGILAGRPFKATLFGDESLSKRPMRRVTEPLSEMGADFNPKDYLPLTVRGGALKGITYPNLIRSAQVKSAVLLAGLSAEGPTSVIEPVPTRDHTERLLRYLSPDDPDDWIHTEKAENGEAAAVKLKPGVRLQARDLAVPGDISSAAFFLVAAAIVPDSSVTVRGVGLNPTRTGFLGVLRRMGADVQVAPAKDDGWEPRGDITVSYRPLRAVEIEPEEVPGVIDELPILMVAASQAVGRSRMRGLDELRVKETDRVFSMIEGLMGMGMADRIEEIGNAVTMEGPCRLHGAKVRSFSDHRTAMALAVAGLAAQGETIVQESEWVNISFPEFARTLEGLRRGG